MSTAWDIIFFFPFDESLAGIRSILSYPLFGTWQKKNDGDTKVPVNVDDLDFDDLHDTGMNLYADLAMDDHRSVEVQLLIYAQYFDHVKDVPPIDKNVCRGVELSLFVFHEAMFRAYGISRCTRECLERVQELFLDLSRSTIARVPVERIYWAVEACSVDGDRLTEELILSGYLGAILPVTHPLARRVRGEVLTGGYTLYNWDIDEQLS